MMGFYTDSHTGPVPDAVWDLLAFVAPRSANLVASRLNFTNPHGPCCGQRGFWRRSRAHVLRSPVPARPDRVHHRVPARAVRHDLEPSACAFRTALGISSLTGYELNAVEQRRLVAVARQPGMSITCYVGPRQSLCPIADAFPLTCSLLKPQLRPLLDELWSLSAPDHYQLSREADAFARFLEGKLSRNDIDHPYAMEIFRYERAAWELMQTVYHSRRAHAPPINVARCVIVRFEHDPAILVPYWNGTKCPRQMCRAAIIWCVSLSVATRSASRP